MKYIYTFSPVLDLFFSAFEAAAAPPTGMLNVYGQTNKTTHKQNQTFKKFILFM